MAEYIRKTKETVTGPWLLDPNSLKSLDELLVSEQQRISQMPSSINQQTLAAIQFRLRMHMGAEGKTEEDATEEDIKTVNQEMLATKNVIELKLSLDTGDEIRAKNFTEAISMPAVKDKRVTGFTYVMKAGDVDCTISFYNLPTNEANISVTPGHLEQATECSYRIQRWFESFRVPLWQTYWARFFAAPVILALILTFVTVLGLDRSTSSVAEHKAEARKLLADGFKEKDHHRALELMLSIQSEYPSPQSATRDYKGFLIVGALIWCVAILCSFPPKTHVAVGLGATSIERTKAWTTIFVWILATVVVSGVIVRFSYENLRSGL